MGRGHDAWSRGLRCMCVCVWGGGAYQSVAAGPCMHVPSMTSSFSRFLCLQPPAAQTRNAGVHGRRRRRNVGAVLLHANASHAPIQATFLHELISRVAVPPPTCMYLARVPWCLRSAQTGVYANQHRLWATRQTVQGHLRGVHGRYGAAAHVPA